MRFSIKNEPTTLDAIRAFEATLGGRLPQSYVDFLLIYNGGYSDSENDYIEVPGWNGLVVQKFLD